MKSLPFLFLFFALLSPLTSYSQEFEAVDSQPVIDEEFIASDEIAAAQDIDVGEERQEDIIHPEGENDWSLGGEDLPSEEYE